MVSRKAQSQPWVLVVISLGHAQDPHLGEVAKHHVYVSENATMNETKEVNADWDGD